MKLPNSKLQISQGQRTMVFSWRAVARIFAGLVFAFASVAACGADLGAAWSRYFPDRVDPPAAPEAWSALAKEFPHRVKPAPDPEARPVPPPATRLEIYSAVNYLRVRQLAQDLTTIASVLEHPRVVIDLRYVRGELEEALRFGQLLARQPLTLEGTDQPIEPRVPPARTAQQITLCLINRATAGPLEAVLDALQHAGDVLLVGTQSAGDTGIFTTVPSAPDWRVIVGDYRRAGGPPLLDVGVTPALFVETVPDTEDAAYLALDSGRALTELLDAPVEKTRFDEARLQQHFERTRNGNGHVRSNPPATGPDAPSAEPAATAPNAPEDDADPPATETSEATEADAAQPAEPPPFDRSLQRAVNTLIAHQILREKSTDATQP